MAVPSCEFGDFLVTDGTESVLLFPKLEQPVFAFQCLGPMRVETSFIVALPLWVVGVCLGFDFRVSLNVHIGRLCKVIFLTSYFSEKDPVVPRSGLEVFLRHPGVGFLWVSSVHPPSQCAIDRVVYIMKHIRADDMPMILCPSTNDGIEYQDQSACGQRVVFLDDLPNLFQVSMYILLCWFNQQFGLLSCFVLTYVLTQEIEPILNMRNAGFLA